MDASATACAWCGAGGDNGSAASFVSQPNPVVASPVALAGDGAAPDTILPPIVDPSEPLFQKNLQGIGGWLILVAIDLAVDPLGYLLILGGSLFLMLSPAGQTLLAVRPGVGGLLLLNAAIDTLFIVALIVLNLQFYAKKKTFPRLVIGYLAASFILQVAIHQMIIQYMPTFPSFGAFDSLIAAGVWIPYFLLSKRVKQTFVN